MKLIPGKSSIEGSRFRFIEFVYYEKFPLYQMFIVPIVGFLLRFDQVQSSAIRFEDFEL